MIDISFQLFAELKVFFSSLLEMGKVFL
jgi:hypothetical protein